ncbi:hypothetical protein L3Q82_004646 [Scortum barcoo]|uniref:Uncharacterized protein n=1 Tax=Scortum barcoo TaxID=214431 RepID=A0ACB8VGR2_9TELE|nr:hypothetical protein L3Q82_004646 [Scortum barcoo]
MEVFSFLGACSRGSEHAGTPQASVQIPAGTLCPAEEIGRPHQCPAPCRSGQNSGAQRREGERERKRSALEREKDVKRERGLWKMGKELGICRREKTDGIAG